VGSLECKILSWRDLQQSTISHTTLTLVLRIVCKLFPASWARYVTRATVRFSTFRFSMFRVPPILQQSYAMLPSVNLRIVIRQVPMPGRVAKPPFAFFFFFDSCIYFLTNLNEIFSDLSREPHRKIFSETQIACEKKKIVRLESEEKKCGDGENGLCSKPRAKRESLNVVRHCQRVHCDAEIVVPDFIMCTRHSIWRRPA
jgi:hypothetical protein